MPINNFLSTKQKKDLQQALKEDECPHFREHILITLLLNDGKTQQAIAIVLRYGQVSPIVNIYMFTGNTAIEKAIFEKHDSKLNVIDELSQGRPTTKVTRMKIEDIIAIINKEDNIYAIKKVHKELKFDERSKTRDSLRTEPRSARHSADVNRTALRLASVDKL